MVLKIIQIVLVICIVIYPMNDNDISFIDVTGIIFIMFLQLCHNLGQLFVYFNFFFAVSMD